jgi:hypothetical protein
MAAAASSCIHSSAAHTLPNIGDTIIAVSKLTG